MTSSSLPLVSYHRASHIGEGSFGSVVTVYNDDGQEFALKLFDDSQPIGVGALREISCLRLLRGPNKHTNIIELQDVQSDGNDEEAGAGTSGCWSIALPLFKHGSLASAIARFRGNKAAKVKLAHDILSAVQFLHDNGILHRDIKCDNVLLDQNGRDEWRAVVIDFSLAKPINRALWGVSSPACALEATQHTGEVGTVVYTAPEIVNRQKYGEPCDMYSVGIVLLELLRNALFTAEKHREGAAQVATALNELNSQPFPNLIRSLLQQDPEERPSAQQALSHEIFSMFGLVQLKSRRINIATALPYEGEEEENEPPASVKSRDKRLQRRLRLIDRFLNELNSLHPWTRSTALEYSQQYEQLDDEIDNVESSQSLADCCVLAHRFWEVDVPDLDELEQQETGVFSSWKLEKYIDNEATIFMILDYCLYPRKLTVKA